MKDWFADITDVTDLRNKYRELIKKYHPDNNGDVVVMQEINVTYDAKLKEIREGMTDYERERYTDANDNEFKAILNKIVNFNMDVEIIGCWIWCFNSYAYRQQLKELYHNSDVSFIFSKKFAENVKKVLDNDCYVLIPAKNTVILLENNVTDAELYEIRKAINYENVIKTEKRHRHMTLDACIYHYKNGELYIKLLDADDFEDHTGDVI